MFHYKGAFTLANFARDFALSLHILLNKNYLFSLLNVQASAKSRAKLCQCKRTFNVDLHNGNYRSKLVHFESQKNIFYVLKKP